MFANSKSLAQAAALPYVLTPTGPLVCLVTSRERGRWIAPKGWPIAGLELWEVAAREASEEAGLAGDVAMTPIGAFDYMKRAKTGYDVPCRVYVYPLETALQLLDWPERGERRLAWLPPADAARQVSDRGLAKILRTIADAPELLKTPANSDDARAAAE